MWLVARRSPALSQGWVTLGFMSWGIGVVVFIVGGVVGALAAWLVASARGQAQLVQARSDAARASAALDAQQQLNNDRLRSVQDEQARLAHQFRALASEALAANNEQFLDLAEQHLVTLHERGRTEITQRSTAVEQMVEPLRHSLKDLTLLVGQAEQARASTAATLGEQVRTMANVSEQLRKETQSLVAALRTPDVRGSWGEAQLRRLVESAGMLRHVDFSEQLSVRTDDGVLRPDMVIHLAGGKNVVVDSKVALIGFLDARDADTEKVRLERLKAHAQHVRKHVDMLADKKYWDQFTNSPEFVVLFLPAESFLASALDVDNTLLDHAFSRNVVIATPTTLMALLKTVGYTWRQESVTENAQAVLKIGKELHSRLATLAEHLNRLGRSIQGVAETYNKTVGSFESRVFVSARRFQELGVTDAGITQAEPVTVAPRQVDTPSFTAEIPTP